MSKQATKLTIFSITWPIFFEILLLMFLGNIDIFMLSQYSDDSVASIGVSNQLLQFSLVMFGFVSAGAAVIISQYIGAKKEQDAKSVSVVAIISSVVFGLAVSLIFVLFRIPFLNFMGVQSHLISEASFYLMIVGGFVFIQAILTTIGAILRSYGYTKDMLYVTLVMNIFNALGNAVVIFGLFGIPVLGVTGVAVVTAISKLIGLILAFIMLMRHVPGITKAVSRKNFPIHYIKSILKIGLPAAGENLSYQGYQLVVVMILTSLGTTVLTTHIYSRSMNMFIILFTISIAQGGAIIIGQLTGAKEYDEIYKRCLKYLKYSILISGIGAVVFFLLHPYIIGLFTDNPDAIPLARQIFLIGIILEPGRAYNIVIINALRATGDVKFPVYAAIIFMWGVGAFLSWLLGIIFGWGLLGVLIAMALDEWIRGLLMLWRWKTKIWTTKGVIE